MSVWVFPAIDANSEAFLNASSFAFVFPYNGIRDTINLKGESRWIVVNHSYTIMLSNRAFSSYEIRKGILLKIITRFSKCVFDRPCALCTREKRYFRLLRNLGLLNAAFKSRVIPNDRFLCCQLKIRDSWNAIKYAARELWFERKCVRDWDPHFHHEFSSGNNWFFICFRSADSSNLLFLQIPYPHRSI